MTEYEIYSYEAFRKKYQDDLREIPRASFASLNQETLKTYLEKVREGNRNSLACRMKKSVN